MIYRILLFVVLLIMLITSAHTQTKERITYDDNGRISKVVFTQSNQMLTINYEYDKRGNITSTSNELVTGVDDEKSTSLTITVRPNPSTHDVTIDAQAQNGEMVKFVVTATDGREVYRTEARADIANIATCKFDASSAGLAAGSYQVSATTQKGITTAGFVIGK